MTRRCRNRKERVRLLHFLLSELTSYSLLSKWLRWDIITGFMLDYKDLIEYLIAEEDLKMLQHARCRA